MAREQRSQRVGGPWFDAGLKALGALHPGWDNGYVCPLCLRAFPDATLLSREDVPPKSVGGKPLVLTCLECNSVSGHTVDAHAFGRERLRQLARRELTEPLKAVMTANGGNRVPIDFTFADGVATMAVAVKASSQASQSALVESFHRRCLDPAAPLGGKLEFDSTTQPEVG